MNEWEHNGSDIVWALYNAHKKSGQFFYHPLTTSTTNLNKHTCLNVFKDTSILLKVINIWTSS